MISKDCPLFGLKTVHISLLGDARGFFSEIFQAKKFADMGLPTEFAQDNHSRSAPGSLRGLHFQHTPVQGKLIRVARGRILDVALDIRPDSPTFGQHHTELLSDENGVMLWMPPGFAHGFCVLGDEPADVFYKVTDFYNRDGEGGIRYDDPDLNIDWGIKHPVVSARDKALPLWRDVRKQLS